MDEWNRFDVKPARVGVYERESPYGGINVYSVWDGYFWRKEAQTPENAYVDGRFSYDYWSWRVVQEVACVADARATAAHCRSL